MESIIHRFFVFLILASFLKLPDIKASYPLPPTVERDAIERGAAIYHALSHVWIRSRGRIAREGLQPFLFYLEDASLFDLFSKDERDIRNGVANLLWLQEKPDINSTLCRRAADNRTVYGRSSLFETLNILEEKAFFRLLGLRYYSATSLMLDILRNHLKEAQRLYDFTYRLLDVQSPTLKRFLEHDIFGSDKDKRQSPLYKDAIKLLWFEPYQILPYAINAHIEELFKQANDEYCRHEPGSL